MKPEVFDRDELGAELNNARAYAVSFIAASLSLGLFISEIKRIRELSHTEFLDYCYICLLLLIGSLIFVWIWATEKELELLRRWLYPKVYDPPSSLKETVLIMSIAITLVFLFYSARVPLRFGVAFIVYNLLALLATIYMNRELKRAFEDTVAHLKTSAIGAKGLRRLQLKGINILTEYYLRNPHVCRYAVTSVCSVVGFAFALVGHFKWQRLMDEAAYTIYIFTIMSTEVLIAIWRNYRDLRIRQLNSKLRAFLADNPLKL